MPPRSRGAQENSKAAMVHATAQARSSRPGVNHARQNAPGVGSTTTMILYPLLLLALAILHLLYSLVIKAQSFVRHLRWTDGVSSAALESHANAQLLLLASLTRQPQASAMDADDVMRLKLAKSKGPLVPSHVAISLGSKPMRTTRLFARLVLSLFASRKGIEVRQRDDLGDDNDEHGHDRDDERGMDEEQRAFAISSMHTAIRCCALAGIEQVTICDVHGHLSALYDASQEQALSDTINEQDRTLRKQRIRVQLSISKPTLGGNLDRIDTSPPTEKGNGLHRVQELGNGQVETRHVRLHLLGPQDGKDGLAKVASVLLDQRKELPSTKPIDEHLVNAVLRRHHYPSEPDLLILHGGQRRVATLHGFPPWLVRLCEVYHDVDAVPYRPLTSTSFLRAIKSFRRSEQRYGK